MFRCLRPNSGVGDGCLFEFCFPDKFWLGYAEAGYVYPAKSHIPSYILQTNRQYPEFYNSFGPVHTDFVHFNWSPASKRWDGPKISRDAVSRHLTYKKIPSFLKLNRQWKGGKKDLEGRILFPIRVIHCS